jgi:hypothetical protein
MENVYTDTIATVVQNKTSLESLISSKWMNIRSALMAGDVENALKNFVATSQQRYRDVFNQMSAVRINAIFSGITDVKIQSQNENIVECDVIRQEVKGAIAYPVTFILDSSGMWKVFGF